LPIEELVKVTRLESGDKRFKTDLKST